MNQSHGRFERKKERFGNVGLEDDASEHHRPLKEETNKSIGNNEKYSLLGPNARHVKNNLDKLVLLENVEGMERGRLHGVTKLRQFHVSR